MNSYQPNHSPEQTQRFPPSPELQGWAWEKLSTAPWGVAPVLFQPDSQDFKHHIEGYSVSKHQPWELQSLITMLRNPRTPPAPKKTDRKELAQDTGHQLPAIPD